MELKKLTILFLLLASFIAGCAGLISYESSPEKCASCHSDSLVFKEWQNSGHANSLETLLEDSDAEKKCVKCHSSDYQRIPHNLWIFSRNVPTPEAANDPVSCSACHGHNSGMESNLLASPDRLCAACHTLYCGG